MPPHASEPLQSAMEIHEQASPKSTMKRKTKVIPVDRDRTDFGSFAKPDTRAQWDVPHDLSAISPLVQAAGHIRKEGSTPVAFPTETVYGLGADATSSRAVKGIYRAKGRPSDNPLIVHICDLTMLRSLLIPLGMPELTPEEIREQDVIPAIYIPVIERFWPGPLTIILPNPSPSKLAPEVTAGLTTFGARMPFSPLALSLISLAGVPLAAPSANASTKPSPTTAEHVLHDLEGKIDIILDGGPCEYGVESTVIDGTCRPPVVLRPGSIPIDAIRTCKGWERVRKAYKDASEIGSEAPRAPGMKYKHYSPKAAVILYETSSSDTYASDRHVLGQPSFPLKDSKTRHITQHILDHALNFPDRIPRVGVITTKKWNVWPSLKEQTTAPGQDLMVRVGDVGDSTNELGNECGVLRAHVVAIPLGEETRDIARGLFSALRELDEQGVDYIHVEGIDDLGDDSAAAVMNRLRKAATDIIE